MMIKILFFSNYTDLKGYLFYLIDQMNNSSLGEKWIEGFLFETLIHIQRLACKEIYVN